MRPAKCQGLGSTYGPVCVLTEVFKVTVKFVVYESNSGCSTYWGEKLGDCSSSPGDVFRPELLQP